MKFGKYAETLSRSLGLSLVCDEWGKYDVEEHRDRDEAANAVRAESEKLAAERDARERKKDRGPNVRFRMTEGLLPPEVDREIAHGRRAGDIGHRVVAFYLADCADRGLYQAFGHSSVIPYAVKRHRISRRKARDLIAAGKALRDLVKVDSAFIDGSLFWSQVRVIAKVADLETEEEWIAFAKSHTIEELEGAARRAKKGDRPRTDGKGLEETRFTLSLRVSVLLFEQYALARQRMSADLQRDVTDEEFAGSLIESALRKDDQGAQSADSLYRVVVDVNAAEGGATIRGQEGPVPVDPATAETICCDAGVLTPDGKAHETHAPPIPEGLRQRIRARDGYRCLVCSSRSQLHVHHIEFRSEGGQNTWANLMTACVRCHALVHGGFLSITGRAPGALVFRDRKGDLLTDPARVVDGDRKVLEIEPPTTRQVAHGGPLNSGNCAEKQGVLKACLPAEIDPLWLQCHRHLMSFETTRTALRLGEGEPLPPPAQVAEPVPDLNAVTPEPQNPLRPSTLDEVVGQGAVVAWLKIAVAAALRTLRMPSPLLLLGQSGLGKTTLAWALARELGSRLKVIDSSTIENPLTLLGHLMDLRERDVLFFDEIHALPRKLGEALYQAVEEGVIDLPFVDGVQTKSVRFRLPKVTFIAATTNPERMPGPLMARFHALQLSPYSPEDLAEIVRRAAARDSVGIAEEALPVIAKASSGIARMAIELYTRTRTLVEAEGRTTATADDARAALRALELDDCGLGPVHHRVLDILRKHGRPLAVRRLATWAGITVDAFRKFFEPALMMSGAIVPTPRGIVLGRRLAQGIV